MKREIKAGHVDYTALVYIPDPASTDGSGKTGLVAANLTVSYTRVETDNDVVVTDVTSSLSNLANLTAAHADWGLLEVSNTLAPGLYRLDIADAVFASGAWAAVVYVMITTSAAAASPMEFVLVAHDVNDGVRMGLTALPAVAAEAAGGLYTRGTGAGQINQVANGMIDANDVRFLGTAYATPTVAGVPEVDLTHWMGTALTVVLSGGRVPSNVERWLGTAVATPTIAGIPEVDLTHINGVAQTATLDTIKGDTDDIGVAGAGLTAADDAVIAAIAALNNITAASVWAVATRQLTAAQTFDITGNLSGTVGSVTGAVGSVTGLTAANLDAAVSTRASQTSVDDLPTNAELATALGTADDAVLAQVALVKAKTDGLPTDPADHSLIIVATDAIVTAIGALNNITAASVWAAGTRTLTAGTNIALAKGTGVTGFNDLSAAQVNAEADTAIVDAALATAANLATLSAFVDTEVAAIKVVTDALGAASAAMLKLSAGTIVTGTVNDAVTTPTTTVFAASDITEATADHFNGRVIIFTTGALAKQATEITDYALVSGEGKFTVAALTEAPADGDTFVII